MVHVQSSDFEQVLRLALRLSPLERIEMIERLAASFQDEAMLNAPEVTGAPFSDEELEQLMRVEPASPEAVVAEGLLGTWADMDISDGASWVNEQKRQRRERRRW